MNKLRPLLLLLLFAFYPLLNTNVGNVSADENIPTYDEASTPQYINTVDGEEVTAEAAILIDSNGLIWYGKNIDKQVPIASLTKMMTVYITLLEVQKGNISMDDRFYPSEIAANTSLDTTLSNVPLNSGYPYLVSDLVEMAILESANGAAITLAENISGSEEEFVKLMNETAQELGMKNTVFYNSSGLSEDDMQGNIPEDMPETGNVSTARDMAILSKAVYENTPEYIEISKLYSTTVETYSDPEMTIYNTNQLIDDENAINQFPGVDGLKTGSYPEWGYSVAFTCDKNNNGNRVFGVVLNSPDTNARFSDARTLLINYYNVEHKTIIPEGYSSDEMKNVPIKKAYSLTTNLETTQEFAYDLNNDDTNKLKWKITYSDEFINNGVLVAPIEQGEVIGYFTLDLENMEEVPLYFLNSESSENWGIPITVSETVSKSNIAYRFLTGIVYWFTDVIAVTQEFLFE